MNNAERAERARTAIYQYAENAAEELETHFTDLLADMLHLCEKENINFEDRLASSRNHFEAETQEEKEEGKND